MKTSRERRQYRREEIREWKAAGKSYRLPADIRFQRPFWPPLRKDRQNEKERKQCCNGQRPEGDGEDQDEGGRHWKAEDDGVLIHPQKLSSYNRTKQHSSSST
ncbi:hypothetical protein XENORESO_005652 [Xenotaenia resolanae]|uniref:Uncharacterized protein n=1 Tax=Xenotaenia resolanae TaxID=208358 RepID=A0ABV0WXI5_9TELE